MKLTLRELFLLVALAAMGCAWWVDRYSKEVHRRQLWPTQPGESLEVRVDEATGRTVWETTDENGVRTVGSFVRN